MGRGRHAGLVVAGFFVLWQVVVMLTTPPESKDKLPPRSARTSSATAADTMRTAVNVPPGS
jgi:hypothetical protein